MARTKVLALSLPPQWVGGKKAFSSAAPKGEQEGRLFLLWQRGKGGETKGGEPPFFFLALRLGVETAREKGSESQPAAFPPRARSPCPAEGKKIKKKLFLFFSRLAARRGNRKGEHGSVLRRPATLPLAAPSLRARFCAAAPKDLPPAACRSHFAALRQAADGPLAFGLAFSRRSMKQFLLRNATAISFLLLRNATNAPTGGVRCVLQCHSLLNLPRNVMKISNPLEKTRYFVYNCPAMLCEAGRGGGGGWKTTMGAQMSLSHGCLLQTRCVCYSHVTLLPNALTVFQGKCYNPNCN